MIFRLPHFNCLWCLHIPLNGSAGVILHITVSDIPISNGRSDIIDVKLPCRHLVEVSLVESGLNVVNENM